jgi:2-keto-4-pentenoate hydratase/2-oxohepta-3-ene-1,7-dioic acid hydratase in catechol pathway
MNNDRAAEVAHGIGRTTDGPAGGCPRTNGVPMKVAMVRVAGDGPTAPAIVTGGGFVSLGELLRDHEDAQLAMSFLISYFHELRPEIEDVVQSARPLPPEQVTLIAPVPRPTNMLCCIGNYWEHADRPARPLYMYMKNPDAVVDPGGEIVLPESTEPWMFMHEAELGIVMKGPVKDVPRHDWRQAVFGFTGIVDVSARGHGRRTWGQVSWMGKSFDTFAPIGPWISTADEIPDPQDLHVRLWNDGQLRHDYSTEDMEHGVPEIVELASSVMTLQSGDLIACGTNHEGLGAVQDGEKLDFEIERIGRMSLSVSDPLGRSWERGVYLGADSTNAAVVKGGAP